MIDRSGIFSNEDTGYCNPDTEITIHQKNLNDEVSFYDDRYFVYQAYNDICINVSLEELPEDKKKYVSEKRKEIDLLVEDIINMLVHGIHFRPIPQE